MDEQEQRAREITKEAEEVSKTWKNVSNKNNCDNRIDNNGGSSKPFLKKGQIRRRQNTGCEIFSTLLILSVFLYPTHSRSPSLTHAHTHTHTHTHILSLCVSLSLRKKRNGVRNLLGKKMKRQQIARVPAKCLLFVRYV